MGQELKAAPILFEMDNKQLLWQDNLVLRDLCLSIKEGEKVALIGKSGAGKSTLLAALYQQHPSKVAFCQQLPGLVPSLSVFHNIYMGSLDRHSFAYNTLNLFWPLKKEKLRITELSQKLDLQDTLDQVAETLSGGQQQRVALARSLIQEKSVFIGDEPVSALDEVQAERLLKMTLNAHQTVIVALHNTEHALKYCQRVIGLKDGRIALDASVEELSSEDIKRLYSDFDGHSRSADKDAVSGHSDALRSAEYPELVMCR